MAINVKKELKPTEEQKTAIELFAEGDNLAIEAGAGTGKTSTLSLLGKYNKSKGQYIAFNKSIVEEAKGRFPRHIKCNTAHSLAYSAVGKDYADRLFNSRRIKSVEVANHLGIKPRVVSVGGKRKVLSASYLASIVMRGISNWCQTADTEFSTFNIPYIDGIDMPEGGRKTYHNNNEISNYLMPFMSKAWSDLQNPTGFVQFKHEHYLKMFQLGNPVIDADFILFDEAQDANPVMLDIVSKQDHAQLVFVGDSQQQIYSWMGAINAMDKVPSDNKTYLTQSFRFGPAIAEQANKILSTLGADLRLKGLESIESIVGVVDDPDVLLCRTNAYAIKSTLTYQKQGKDVALVGGASEILKFAEAAKQLMSNRKVYHPELSCFDDWGDVRDYVANDEQGDELKLMVGLVDHYGVDTIIDALAKTKTEKQADVIISTAHKSKGREWDRVRLGADFPPIEKMTPEEWRLLYVAVTRAKLELDIADVDAIC